MAYCKNCRLIKKAISVLSTLSTFKYFKCLNYISLFEDFVTFKCNLTKEILYNFESFNCFLKIVCDILGKFLVLLKVISVSVLIVTLNKVTSVFRNL